MYDLYDGQKLALNVFKTGIFLLKLTKGKEHTIFTPKQMLEKLPIALAEVKTGNTSKHLLH